MCIRDSVYIPLIVFLVVWGLSVVIATFSPKIAFISVDFPTLGRPIIPINPVFKCVVPFYFRAFLQTKSCLLYTSIFPCPWQLLPHEMSLRLLLSKFPLLQPYLQGLQEKFPLLQEELVHLFLPLKQRPQQ